MPDVVNGQNQVQVFPNPIRDRFFVYFRNFSASTAFIQLYNSIGQLIYSQQVILQNGSEFIEISSARLPVGIYEVKITTTNGVTVVKKLLK